MTVEFTTVTNAHEVELILALQAENHRDHVDAVTAAREGFTRVRHDPAVLHAMNVAYPSSIALAGTQLAGYCLMMAQEFRDQAPVLRPMFNLRRSRRGVQVSSWGGDDPWVRIPGVWQRAARAFAGDNGIAPTQRRESAARALP